MCLREQVDLPLLLRGRLLHLLHLVRIVFVFILFLTLLTCSVRRLRDLGGLASGLDADDLARTGLNKAAREEIRALRAERAFVQARLNVLSRVAENLQERERELTGKEWGPDDFEESGPGSSGSSGGEEQDDAEGDPDAEYEEAGGKKKDAKTKAKVKAKATRGGGKPKGK